MKKFITRNIFLLAMVSFFTDIASEILFPVMPLYLASIGFSVLALGVMEGVAESVAGLSKAYFGFLSDKLHKRNIFIRIGYALSAISKPLFVYFSSVGAITALRAADRFGKGIRTAPRDAVLTTESTPENRGKVFGFHRGMDTLGATLGPIVALVFLYFNPGEYKQLFLWVIIPGALAVLFTLLLRKKKDTSEQVEEAKQEVKEEKKKITYKEFWRLSKGPYRKLIIGLAVVAFINTSDMFLILRAHELGIGDLQVILAYIIYNLVFTLAAVPAGYLSDRFGFKKIYIIGLFVFVAVYGTLAYDISLSIFMVALAVYGIFSAVYQGASNAWLSLYIPKGYEATGMGLFLMMQSFAVLFGSILFASVWGSLGAQVAFAGVAVIALIVAVYFSLLSISDKAVNQDGENMGKLGCIGSH